jgi:hypothetical protein
MYRITCASRAVIVNIDRALQRWSYALMYGITGHYPVAAPGRPPPGTG